jgi:alanine racemase
MPDTAASNAPLLRLIPDEPIPFTDAAQALLEVDLDAIAANWRALHRHRGGRPTAAVVKADAYGVGAAHVVPRLFAEGCRHFFVAHLEEAVALRPLVPSAMIAPLNGLVPGTEAEYLAYGITPVLNSLGEMERWATLARRVGRRLEALLHIDTGLNRLGMEAAEFRRLVAAHEPLEGISLLYIMSHLIAAETPEDPANRAQLARFQAACASFPGVPRSLVNSAGIFLGAAFQFDLARPGAGLYGVNPTPGQPSPVRPAVRLRARVLQVREVQPGEGVGYEATWRAARASRIAVVGVGYADGWLRALSNRGRASFDGVAVPLVGRVSMDLSTYDVTEAPALQPGDWLELIGPHQSLEEIAAAAGTSAYEILTGLGRRYKRVWHG